jgi:hypothetical protein
VRRRAELAGAACDRLRIAADDDDARAFIDQPLGDRQADAAVAAGDERHLAFEASSVHVFPPLSSKIVSTRLAQGHGEAENDAELRAPR